ncbi:MAG: hypothetical protein MJ220_01195 [Bacilli bacterium]|nr:hypothetical protein [Bacilli bacterium]
MEALKILKKMAMYLIYFVCGSLLLMQVEKIALYNYTYIEEGGVRTLASSLLDGVYMPLMFAMLFLIVMLLTQFVILREQEDNEKRLASIANVVFFAVIIFTVTYTAIYGISKINADPTLPSYEYLLYPLVPLASIAIAEEALAIVDLIKSKKAPKTEE